MTTTYVSRREFINQWRDSSKNVTAQLVQNEVRAAAFNNGFTDLAADEFRDKARVLAADFILQCGYDTADSDQLGDEMGRSVADALTFAFMRLGIDEVVAVLNGESYTDSFGDS